jgi:hypothetical protein
VANRIRIKRRVSGQPGSPATLLNGELAFNEVDGNLMYGKGLGQDGNATSVIVIGGDGTFATKSYVTSAVAAVDVSSQLANYLTTANAATTYLTISSASSTYLSQASASSTYAPLASPTFTGTPSLPSGTTATTQSAGDSSTKLATTAYVSAAVSSLINGAPELLNTLSEISAALNNDASFSATITTSLGTKADRTLSNLSDASAARTNLGLGSMATQAANNVAITGGSIDNITIDSGTF